MTDILLSFSFNEAFVLGMFIAAGLGMILYAVNDPPQEKSLTVNLVNLIQLVRISDNEHEVWVRTESGLIINYTITREVFNQIVDMIDHERINDITT